MLYRLGVVLLLCSSTFVLAHEHDEISKLQKECRNGDAEHCTDLAFAYANGRGIEQDLKKAIELYTKACEKDPLACANLSYHFREGIGVEKSREKALYYSKKACDAEDSIGCTELGLTYEMFRDDEVSQQHAVAAFIKGCSFDNADACFHLAEHYSKGIGVAKDPVRAQENYEQACMFGIEEACKLASFHEDKP